MTNYIKEFHHLRACTNLMENEQNLLARFVSGLRFDIKEKMYRSNFLYSVEVII